MRSSLLLFVAFLITDVKALSFREEQFKNNYEYRDGYGYGKLKAIPTIRYELTNPNLSILQIKDWYHFFFQNKICWWKIDLRGSSYKNMKLYKPLHLRYNMRSADIENALRDSFHPQELKQQKGTILIVDYQRSVL